MKVYEQRSGKAVEADLAQAVAESVQATYGDGELERMREQMSNQADALGKLFAFVLKANFGEEAKMELLGEVLNHRFTVLDD